MLDFLLSLFKKKVQLGNVSLIAGHVADIIEILNEEYMIDVTMKNNAIDAVIDILRDHKEL